MAHLQVIRKDEDHLDMHNYAEFSMPKLVWFLKGPQMKGKPSWVSYHPIHDCSI